MQQTMDADHIDPTLLSRGETFNAGGFCDLAHRGDKDCEIGFDLTLRQHIAAEPHDDPFQHAPGKIAVRFRRDHNDRAELTRFQLFNAVGKKMLERRKLHSGKYSLTGMAFSAEPPLSEFDRVLRTRI